MLANNLMYLMETQGLSQTMLAEKAGIPQSAISEIINNKRTSPGMQILLKLSKALSCTLDELVGTRSA